MKIQRFCYLSVSNVFQDQLQTGSNLLGTPANHWSHPIPSIEKIIEFRSQFDIEMTDCKHPLTCTWQMRSQRKRSEKIMPENFAIVSQIKAHCLILAPLQNLHWHAMWKPNFALQQWVIRLSQTIFSKCIDQLFCEKRIPKYYVLNLAVLRGRLSLMGIKNLFSGAYNQMTRNPFTKGEVVQFKTHSRYIFLQLRCWLVDSVPRILYNTARIYRHKP